MKITITLEVPDGTHLTMGNDSELLTHKDHPDFAHKLTMNDDDELRKVMAQSAQTQLDIDHVRKINAELVGMIRKLEGREVKPGAQVAIPPAIKLPVQTFHCATHGDFQSETLRSKAPCVTCSSVCDLAQAPRDDQQSIPCIECGTVYDKSKGGKFGTCPACTMVRCPTCRQPASLAEMKDQYCHACDPERGNF